MRPSTPFNAWLSQKHRLALFEVKATGLVPDTEYVWEMEGAGQPIAARTLPLRLPADGLAVAVASCHDDYFNFAPSILAAFRSVQTRERIAFRLLVGDNVYLDVAPDQRTFEDGYEETAARYARYWASGAYSELLAACPSLTTWDDHEFWNNYPEFQPHLSRTWATPVSPGLSRRDQYEAAAHEGITLFQEPLNPPPTRANGRCYAFAIPPLNVFVADLRTRRTRRDAVPPELLPDTDLLALEAWLADPQMRGPRVLVLGQPLFLSEGLALGLDWNPTAYTAQHQRILRALDTSPWDVLVVSGDVHYSRLIEHFPRGARRGIFEYVSSPSCHVPTEGSILKNALFGSDLAIGRSDLAAPPEGYTRWYFGTDAPSTFGVLRFTPVGEAVSVDAMFLDASTPAGRPAQASFPKVAPAEILLRDRPCHGTRLFTLTSR